MVVGTITRTICPPWSAPITAPLHPCRRNTHSPPHRNAVGKPTARRRDTAHHWPRSAAHGDRGAVHRRGSAKHRRWWWWWWCDVCSFGQSYGDVGRLARPAGAGKSRCPMWGIARPRHGMGGTLAGALAPGAAWWIDTRRRALCRPRRPGFPSYKRPEKVLHSNSRDSRNACK
jgi:hypothetical protein